MTETKTIKVTSPTDGLPLGEVKVFTLEEANQAMDRAHQAQKKWAQVPVKERIKKAKVLEKILIDKTDEICQLLTRESGKTIFESYMMELISIINLIGYFCKKAEKLLKPKRIPLVLHFRTRASYLHFKPRGLVFVIAPWNFPIGNGFGEVVMALLAGNAAILKPASLTPLTALKMHEYFMEAGFDPDLVQIITGPGRLASEMIESGKVNYVSFTGSTSVGIKVSEICGRMLIPCAMELGGKAPAIICSDADLEIAARSVVWGSFAHSGQICASVERVYVMEDIYDRFVSRVVELTRMIRQKNPVNGWEADVGAMTDKNQLTIIREQIDDAVCKGAKVLTGGKKSSAGEMYFEPTVIVNVTDDMKIIYEETFGPAMPIMKVRTEDEAITKANNSEYGLLAYVYTRDRNKGRRIAEQIEAGTVMINETLMTHAFAETPWQGVKKSGVGVVHSDAGFLHLTQQYHVNYDTIAMKNMVWFPYKKSVVDLYMRLFKFMYKVGLV